MLEEEVQERCKGGAQGGRILKGTLNDALLKTRISSIPSKHEGIIYGNNHKPAFGNSQSRFSAEKQFNPGPGQYRTEYNQKIFSKKGFGSMASQSKLMRLERVYSCHAPQKSQQKPVVNKSSLLRKTADGFLAKTSSHSLFKSELNLTKQIPGPGSYKKQQSRTNSSTAISFKSKVQRFNKISINVPPIGHYQLTEPLKKNKKSIMFNSNNKISLKLQSKYIDNLIGIPAKQKNLGPGSYDPTFLTTTHSFKYINRDDERTSYIAKKIYNNEVCSGDNLFQRKVITSCFKSKTKRGELSDNKHTPQPAKYSPFKKDKQSYHFNCSRKWV